MDVLRDSATGPWPSSADPPPDRSRAPPRGAARRSEGYHHQRAEEHPLISAAAEVPAETVEAVIEERGNDLPTAGDYVPGEGELWRVVSVGQIQTGAAPGLGNWVRATVALAEWDDCEEDDVYPASLVVEA